MKTKFYVYNTNELVDLEEESKIMVGNGVIDLMLNILNL
jgi:hypothetical protein